MFILYTYVYWYGREILNEDSQCDVYEYHHIKQVHKYIHVTTQAER